MLWVPPSPRARARTWISPRPKALPLAPGGVAVFDVDGTLLNATTPYALGPEGHPWHVGISDTVWLLNHIKEPLVVLTARPADMLETTMINLVVQGAHFQPADVIASAPAIAKAAWRDAYAERVGRPLTLLVGDRDTDLNNDQALATLKIKQSELCARAI